MTVPVACPHSHDKSSLTEKTFIRMKAWRVQAMQARSAAATLSSPKLLTHQPSPHSTTSPRPAQPNQLKMAGDRASPHAKTDSQVALICAEKSPSHTHPNIQRAQSAMPNHLAQRRFPRPAPASRRSRPAPTPHPRGRRLRRAGGTAAKVAARGKRPARAAAQASSFIPNCLHGA